MKSGPAGRAGEISACDPLLLWAGEISCVAKFLFDHLVGARENRSMPSAHTSVSIPRMWRWGRLEFGATQYHQAVGERLVAERTTQASVNTVVPQNP
jgi:hypothetical protein